MDNTASSPNVTYLLGAGASAQALPVVSDMKDRMQFFMNILENSPPDLGLFEGIDGESKSNIITNFKKVLSEALVHSSPDTYAKKLFLKGDNEKLKWLKAFLSTYFLFEQGQMVDNLGMNSFRKEHFQNTMFQNYLEVEVDEKNEFLQKINKNLDERYDVFLATLLEKETRVLPPHINILSWNYDFQIELSYYEFFKDSIDLIEIGDILKVYPLITKDDCKIIKLNGIAGLYQFDQAGRSRIAYEQMNNFLTSKRFEDFLKPYFNLFLNNLDKPAEGNQFNPFLNFAWEPNPFSNIGNKLASEILSKTEILVIIGYSFPNFNREIDKVLLKTFMSGSGSNDSKIGKKIYYQAPQPYIGGLVRRLKGLMPSGWHNKIFEHDETDQFLIPYEL